MMNPEEITYRGKGLYRLYEWLTYLTQKEGFEVANVTVTSSGWVIRVLLASPEKLPPEA